jgi:hypothetical protein
MGISCAAAAVPSTRHQLNQMRLSSIGDRKNFHRRINAFDLLGR